MEISEAVLIPPETTFYVDEKIPKPIKNITNGFSEKIEELISNGPSSITSQKLEEKAQKAQEALEKEEKARKELEALNSKLLAEKTALLDSLSGEKGALQDYQEKCAKLTAQKNDLDNQLRVSTNNSLIN